MKELLVISSYPPLGSTHNKRVVGVATYTKNTLIALVKAIHNNNETPSVTVLAEYLPEGQRQYTEDAVTVKRIWKRNNFATFFSLGREIFLNHKETKNVLFELELAMFGGIVHLLPLPFFFLILKLLNKKVTVVFHQIIPDSAAVHGQLNIPQNGFIPWILTIMLRVFYRFALLLTDKAIVFDTFLKKQLSIFGSAKKIIVIPHGIELFPKVSQSDARKQLKLPQNRTILLYFGFLAWYKGTDLLIEAYKNIPDSADKPLLIIAGGPNPNHADKKFYQEYLSNIKKSAAEHDVTITGFVPEELISSYFAAVDICILPYRTFMSSSGPLSFVIGSQTPFLISDALSPLFATEDIDKLIKKEDLDTSQLIFKTPEDLIHKIAALQSDTTLQKKVMIVEEKLSKSRSWNAIGEHYYATLFAQTS